MPRFLHKPTHATAVRLTSTVTVEHEQGTIYGEPGDWLVTGSEGEQYIIPHRRFVTLYEPADESATQYLDNVRDR